MNGSVNVPGYTAAEVNKIVEDFKNLLKNYAPSEHDHLKKVIRPHGVELTPSDGSKHGGYIDFHHPERPDTDHTTRIAEYEKGKLSLETEAGNIGNIAAVKQYHLGLLPTDWNGLTQAKDAPGVTEDNVVIVAPSAGDSSYAMWCEGNIRCTAQEKNKLTFSCDVPPKGAVGIEVLILTI